MLCKTRVSSLVLRDPSDHRLVRSSPRAAKRSHGRREGAALRTDLHCVRAERATARATGGAVAETEAEAGHITSPDDRTEHNTGPRTSLGHKGSQASSLSGLSCQKLGRVAIVIFGARGRKKGKDKETFGLRRRSCHDGAHQGGCRRKCLTTCTSPISLLRFICWLASSLFCKQAHAVSVD